MCYMDGPTDLFRCEIFRIGPGAKLLAAQIDCVGSRVDGSQESFIVSRRRQQFDFGLWLLLVLCRGFYHLLNVSVIFPIIALHGRSVAKADAWEIT